MKRLLTLLLLLLVPGFLGAQGYAVGQIPYETGISPTGGRTVSVPIMTAPCRGAVPQISIVYNSQGDEGTVGYGWDLGGLSNISLAYKNRYYDDAVGAPDPDQPDGHVFSLDGMRLVANQDEDFPSYGYVSVQGNVYVRKLFSRWGVSGFEVLRPDGSHSSYGMEGNIETKFTYPLREAVDALGYKVKYQYIEDNNRYYVTSVRYGSQTDSLPSEIRFHYSSRVRPRESYVSGDSLKLTKILDSVVTYNDGLVLRKYCMERRTIGGEECLTGIRCFSYDGEELPPISLSYGHNGADVGLKTVRRMVLPSYPSGTSRLERGKFNRDSYSDGILAYSDSYSNYGIVSGDEEAGDDLEFGSLYPPNETIRVYRSLDSSASPYTITTGTGFIGASAADVDGNGVDEVVKVNYGSFDEDQSTLIVTVYTFYSSSVVQSEEEELDVSGRIQDGEIYSPMSRSCFFGDFLGNGKNQLLTVSHASNGHVNRSPVFTLIDLEDLEVIRETTLSSVYITPDNENRFAAVDMDGDGRTDLYDMRLSNVYSSDDSGVFSLSGNWGVAQGMTPRNRYVLGDINADGLPDMIMSPENCSPTQQIISVPIWMPHTCPYCLGDEPMSVPISRYCTHCGEDMYEYYLNNPSLARCYDCGRTLHDLRDDGSFNEPIDLYNVFECGAENSCQRVIWIGETGADRLWTVYKNSGKGFIRSTQSLFSVRSGDAFLLLDMNRDGCMDLLRYHGSSVTLFMNNSGHFESAGSAIQGTGNNVMPVRFNPMNAYGASHVIMMDGSTVNTVSYGDIDRYLLTTVTDSFGNSTETGYRSSYDSEGSYHPTEVARTFPLCQTFLPVTLLSDEKRFMDGDSVAVANNRYDYYGAVICRDGRGFRSFERISVRDSIRNKVSTEYFDPAMNGVLIQTDAPEVSNDLTYERTVSSNKQESVRLTREEQYDNLKYLNCIKTYTYDAYDYPLTITETRYFDSSEDEEKTSITTLSYTHNHSEQGYRMGLVGTKKIKTDRDGDGRYWREEEAYGYTNGLLTGRTRYVDSDGLDADLLDTEWTYDSYGNVLSEASAKYGGGSYVGKSYTYNSGRTLASETDEIGLTSTYSGYDRYGHPSVSTDCHGNQILYSYDSFGSPVSTSRPDGSRDSTVVSWGGRGKYYVRTVSSSAPERVVHYDALGREILSEEKAFDGSWRKRARLYDSRGRLWKESLPYIDSLSILWTELAYDTYDRPVRIREASGKETTYSYSSYAYTIITKEGIWKRTKENEFGDLVSVWDSCGVINYFLRDDGQPSRITVFGNVTTTFEYDDFGRRIRITDPSAGVRSTSYVDNYDGSSIITETNPNGSVTTTLDRYGRRISTVRSSGFNTTYSYDSYGRLLAETSTNGTKAEYTYDTLDRVQTEKDSAPDGVWLRKAFSYGPQGHLTSIQYTSQEGIIAVENHRYSSGHNIGITLSDSTKVWHLLSENALGQPTSIRTGDITRSYGFSQYGLPTFRMIGNGSDVYMTYSFDPLTGNLLSRGDNTRSLTETFGYDNVGRLVSIGSAQTLYSNKGNILYMDGVGSMSYEDSSKPYRLTLFESEDDNLVLPSDVSVTYTSFDRPSRIANSDGTYADFVYNAAGARVKMTVTDAEGDEVLSRYYLGGCYEYDEQGDGSYSERLYLGGNPYGAPMVMVNNDGNSWTKYNIVRDYLGSITHILTLNGVIIEEYSYDAWGRLRAPGTWAYYDAENQPSMMLGRGYTGHEHLLWFGLINMNARLYDPLVGRFLSPDPYIQAPDFTQNFNRYSYALNNPLKYTDESGETIGWDDLIVAVVGGSINWLINGCKFTNEGLLYFGIGAVGAWASLYVSPHIMNGLISGANSIVHQGFVEGNNWDGSKVDYNRVVYDAIFGSITSSVSSEISPVISKSLEKITSMIPGRAWQGLLNNGLTGYATGFLLGGSLSVITQYKENGKVIWDDVWESANHTGLIGFATGSISGVIQGIHEARKDYKSPWTGEDWYPPKKGFYGESETGILQPGIYDRFGGESGFFLAPEGTPFEQRSLPSYKNDYSIYTRYRVVKPIPGVSIGTTAPWFGFPGGGTQYYLPNPIQYYIENGFIIKL